MPMAIFRLLFDWHPLTRRLGLQVHLRYERTLPVPHVNIAAICLCYLR